MRARLRHFERRREYSGALEEPVRTRVRATERFRTPAREIDTREERQNAMSERTWGEGESAPPPKKKGIPAWLWFCGGGVPARSHPRHRGIGMAVVALQGIDGSGSAVAE